MSLKKTFDEFLNEPLPERVGWPHVFGSMLLAVLGMQFLTGVLLSFVYSPSPLSAHRSVQYLSFQMPAGDWLRGIHYWGASFLIVLLGLHMIRTFVYAAYRKPRQFTWIAGVLLLLCALSFAQTGYLLPWDQRAYWGTTVTVQIMQSVPLAGPWLARLAKGSEVVGALTLSRFYSIHVVVLPLLTVLLILAHLYLIRQFGITAPWSDTGEEPPRNTPFYPYQMAKDSAGMFLILGLLLIFAWLLPAPLGNPADPSDNSFVPRPDWYFLWLFQLLRFFKGPWEIVGTFVLPLGGVLLLLLLPYLDRNPSRIPGKRKLALAGLFFSVLIFAGLTWLAFSEMPPAPPGWVRPSGISAPRAERVKRPSEVAGVYVMQQRCFECHSMTVLGGGDSLQSLSRTAFPSGGEWLNAHLAEQEKEPDLNDRDVEALMSALRILAERDPVVLYTIPRNVRFGANMFYNKTCRHCHKIDGQGGDSTEVKAPDLTLRPLRSLDWHMDHIRDSQSKVPHSKMPPFFHFEPNEYRALAEYILYLHTP